MKKENVEYLLHLNSEQAREVLKAVELLMRLKINQPENLPYNLLDLSEKDYCEKRDEAEPLLRSAFNIMYRGKRSGEWKDAEWYRLYNLYQVLRKVLHDVENPSSTGVDSYPPICLTDEPLPVCEVTTKKQA